MSESLVTEVTTTVQTSPTTGTTVVTQPSTSVQSTTTSPEVSTSTQGPTTVSVVVVDSTEVGGCVTTDV
jgi:hypothetical protein